MSSRDKHTQRLKAKLRSQTHLIALEPRMMFDGAAVATAAATVAPSDAPDIMMHGGTRESERKISHEGDFTNGIPVYQPELRREAYLNDQAFVNFAEAEDIGTVDAAAKSIIFIDTAVENYSDLIAEWADKGEIVLIDADRDGIDQMMAALAGRSGLESIHIVSHGSANRFTLGTTSIDTDAVNGELGEALAAIGAKLSADGDLLIYGCDVSEGSAGQAFLDAIALKTGADVAASMDLTGAAALGGDWDLESRSGLVTAEALDSSSYNALLATGPATVAVWNADTVADGAGTGTLAQTPTGGSSRTINLTLTSFNGGQDGGVAKQTNWAVASGTDGAASTAANSNAARNSIGLDSQTDSGNFAASIAFSHSSGNAVKIVNPVVLIGAVDLTSTSITFQGATSLTIVDSMGVTTSISGNTLTMSNGTNSALTAALAVRVNGTFTGAMNFTTSASAANAVDIGFLADASTDIDIAHNNSVPPARSTAEDTALTYGGVNAFQVVDPDGLNPNTSVTLSSPNGTITLSGTTGLTFSTGDGAADSTMTFSGTRNDVNAALNNLVFNPTPDFNGSTQISISSTIGGVTDNDTAAIIVTPVADIVNDTVTTPEDTPITFNVLTGANGASADNFENGGRAVTSVTQPPAGQGSVSFSADGTINFTPGPDYVGNADFSYTVTSGGTTETASIRVTTTQVQDAPRIDLDGTTAGSNYSANYDQNVIKIGNSITLTDAENNSLTSARVTLSNPTSADRLYISGVAPGITASYNSSTGVLTLTGNRSLADYQTALNNVRFETSSATPGTRTITVDATSGTAPSQSNIATATITVLDSDGDGVANVKDIDDDNDGILDPNDSPVIPGGPLTELIPDPELESAAGWSGNSGYEMWPGGVEIEGNNSTNDPNIPSYIERTLPTVAGQTYVVNVSMYARLTGAQDHFDNVDIIADGTIIGRLRSNTSIQDRNILPPDAVTLTFVATSNSTIFRLQSAGSTPGPSGVQSQFALPGDNVGAIMQFASVQSATNVSFDPDNDGFVGGRLDIDSDNDGITDNVEAQKTAGYISPSGIDADQDGLDDAYDANVGDVSGANSGGLSPVDTDGDGTPDYLDTDSDDDGIGDVAERGDGQPTSLTSTADTDRDGLKDIFEGSNINDGFDANDEDVGAGGIFNLADSDNDTAANGSDAAPRARDLDYRDNVNSPIQAIDDQVSVVEDTTLTRDAANGLIRNDSAISGTIVTSASFDSNGDGTADTPVPLGSATSITRNGTTVGTLTINSDGSYIFTPVANYDAEIPLISYTISNPSGTSSANLLITILPVNDAPTLADTPLTLDAVLSGAPQNNANLIYGKSVAELMGDAISDVDTGAVEGIAVIGTNGGTLYYSLNNGALWIAVTSVSETDALLLASDPNTRLYFRPNAGTPTGPAGEIGDAVTLRAWDQTSGTNGGRADASVTGGSTAFSSATDTIAATVNNQPTFSNTQNLALDVPEDAPVPSGVSGTPLSFFTAGISDSDGDPKGIAISVTRENNGIWWYTLNNGTSWQQVGTLGGQVLLLADNPDTRLYFQPNLNFVGNPDAGASFTIRFYAWDQSTGTAGEKISRSGTAFSSGIRDANITVTPVNDAPVLVDAARTLTAVSEDNNTTTGFLPPVGAVGTQVTAGSMHINNTNVTDVDSGSIKGLAIVGANSANGVFWYSINNGATWTQLGSASEANALLLSNSTSSRIYFQANLDYNGTVADALTIRAWDQTQGTNGATFNIAANGTGGTTAFSTATDVVGITVNPIADIVANTTGNSTPEDTPIVLDVLANDTFENPGRSITAVDGQAIALNGSVNVTNGTVTLIEEAGQQKLRLTPAADFAGTLAFTYSVTSGGAPAETANVSVAVTQVQDAPRIDLDSVAAGVNYGGTYDQAAVAIGNLITVSDPENNNLISMTVTLMGATAADTLSLSTAVTGITALYNPLTGVLTLSGNRPPADYQTALNNVRFQTTSASPASRTITVQGTSGTAPTASNSATATITMLDTDGDNINNNVDIDDDNDGILDSVEGTANSDGDSFVNRLDLDSDNDGITDNVEAQTTAGYLTPRVTGVTDADGDGLNDAYDANVGNMTAAASMGLTPVNTDGDANPDYLDLDSDDDGTLDIAERGDGQPTSVTSMLDADRDGLLDIFEGSDVSDLFDPNDENINATGIFNLADSDNDTAANGSDAAPRGRDLDYRDNLVAPALDLDGNNSSGAIGLNYNTTFSPGGAAVSIADADVTITDDGTTLTGATIQITNNLPGDQLRVNGSTNASGTFGNGISWTRTDTQVILSGTATIAQYQSALQMVAYFNTMPNPSSVTRQISVTVNDGTSTSAVAFARVAINSAPVNTMPAGGYSKDEDNGPLTLTGLQIADANAGTSNFTVTLSVPSGSGTLTATGSGGVGVTGSGTNSIILTGTLDNINSYLAGSSAPQYIQVADFNGSVMLTMTTNDGGNGGATTPATDTDSVAITISPVADIVADSVTHNEDTNVVISPLTTAPGADSFENSNPQITAVAGQAIAPMGRVSVTNGTVTLNNSNQLTFAPNANFAGSSTFSYTVTSGGVTETANITVTTNPVNDAPSGTDNTLTTAEDTPYTFVSGDFGFTDNVEGHGFAAVVISSVPNNGSLTLNGVAVTAGTVVSIADINAGNLKFTPAADDNGTNRGSFMFQVRDNGGTANGGQDTDQSANIINFTVTAVNDAPILDLNGGGAGIDYATSYTEGDAPVAIANANTVTDIDSANMQSASFVIANGSAGDVLSINGTLPAGLSFSYDATTFTATLTGSATKADYATAVSQIRYANTSDAPSTTARTINGTVTDAAGLSSAVAKTTINLTAVNDPIVNAIAVPGYTVAEDGTLKLTGLSVSDPDAGTGSVSVTLSVPNGSGRITAVNGGNVTVSGSGTNSIVLSGTVADINAYLADNTTQPVFAQATADFNGSVQLTMSSNDNGNSGTGGVTSDSDIIAINITPVADIVADTVTTAEDTPISFNPLTGTNGASADNFENVGAAVTSVTQPPPGQGSVSLAADGTITFTPAANYTGSSTFSYTVTSGGVTETADITVMVNAVNDRPTLTVPSTVTTNEDMSVAITGISFADVDAGTGAVRVTLSVPSGTLNWTTTTGVTATGNGSGTLTLTGTVAAINAGMSSALSYAPAADANGPVTLTTTINDQGNTGTDPGTSGDANSEESSATTTINITPVNDAPDARNDSFSTTENSPVTFPVLGNDTDTEGANLTVTQIDGMPIAPGGSVNVTGGSVTLNANGTLTFTPTMGFSGSPSFTYTVSDGELTDTATVSGTVGAISHAPSGSDAIFMINEDATYVFSAASFGFTDSLDGNDFTGVLLTTVPTNGTMRLNGAAVTAGTFVTAAQLAASELTYTPAANANGSGLGSFDFQVRDNGGTANGGQDTDQSANTISFTVAPVNDAPAGMNAILNATEDTPFTFAAVNFGFSDPADNNAFAGVLISTLPAEGTLRLNGMPVAAGTFVTAEQINAGQLVYTPATNANGAGLGSFDFQVRDNGGTANGGQDTDQSANTISFNVAPVNDAPVAMDDSFTIAEDTPVTIDVRANDTDSDPGAILTVTAINGEAIVAGGSGVAVTGGTVTLNAQGNVVFTPNADYNGPTSFTYTVRDDNGATANATVNGTVTPVTDPVTNTAPATASAAEDNVIVFSAANGRTVAVSNPDNGVLTVTLTGTRGLLSLSTVAGLTFTAGDGTSDATMTFSGSQSAINAALDGLQFQPNADYFGDAQVAITTSRDSDGASDSDVIDITITAVADIVADAVTTVEDMPISFNVLTGSNGASPDNFEDSARAVTSVTQPPVGQGSVTFAANGAITYTPAANFNGTTSFTYTVTSGGVTETATVTVNVTAANDAPTIDLGDPGGDTGYAATYTENGPGVAIIDNDGVIADPDNATLSSAKVVITNGSAGDLLAVMGMLPPGITASYDPATYTLTLSGDASPAAYKAALDTVRYSSTSENPAIVDRLIDVTVNDGTADSAPARATISVIPVNDAPDGMNAILNATEDTPYTFTTGNFGFSDLAEGNGFAGVVISTLPAGGTLTLNGVAIAPGDFVTAAQISAGQLVYTPAADANGAGLGSFDFQVRDNGGTANGGQDTDQSANRISFNVTAVNDAPVSSDASVTTPEDTVLTGSLPGYTDVDGDIATYRPGGTSPANGTVTVNTDGSYTYTPNTNFNGSDVFTFIVDDGNGGTVEHQITVTVTPVNDAPAVTTPIPDRSRPDGSSVTFDTSTFFADVDGDPLSFTASGLPTGLTMNANGIITGTVDRSASQGGTNGVYTVTVTASDGQGGTVSDSFAFTATNPAPTAVNDSVTTDEDTPVTFNVLDGTASGGTPDSDPDGDPLTVTAATAGNGTVTIGANGAITYTPNANFNGSDTITYTVSDGEGGTDQAVVNVTVTAVNDAPVTTQIPDQNRNDSDTVTLNASTFFNDPDGDTLTYTASGLPPGLTIDPTTGVISGTIASGASGATGSTVYTITVTANDGNGGVSSITYNNTVLNIAPEAQDDSATTEEDTAVVIDVLQNDTDPDGDPNLIVRVNNQTLTLNGPAVTTTNGSVTLVEVDGKRQLRFQPDADYNGMESFTYTIDDGNSGTNSAVVTVNILPANDAPTAPADFPNIVRADGQTLTYDVGDFFSDPDGDVLNYTVTGLPLGLSMDPATGIISGTIDKNASQEGPATNGIYTVTVTAFDRPGGTGMSQTRSFTLTATNPGPTANNDSAMTQEDMPVTINVLGNDVDPDSDPLTVAEATAGNGTVQINADGTLLYTPNANFNGSDTITYTIDDGNGGRSTATVTVSINAVNDAPTSAAIPPILTSDTAVIDIDTGGFFDDVEDGADLQFSFTGTLPPGLSFDTNTGRIFGTLTNDASSASPYSIDITATDSAGATVTETLVITVQNLPPRAFIDTFTVFEDDGVRSGGNVLDNDVDPDNDGKLVADVNGTDQSGTSGRVGSPVTGSNGGTFVINADGSYTFDPGTAFNDLQVNESRTTSVTYSLDDTDGDFDTTTVTVTVEGLNDAPIASTIPNFTGADGQSITNNPIDVSDYFSDPEGDTLTFSTGSTLPPGLMIDPNTGVITGTIASNASVAGPYMVTVTASDGTTTTDRTFTFNVTNPAPTAVDDNASTSEDMPVDINVIGNDTDPDGDTLTVDPTFPPQAGNGTVTVNPDGTLRYVPNANYNGTDTITYRVTDSQGGMSTGFVTVVVGAVNDAPQGEAIPDIERNDGDLVSINVSGHFSDPDGDTLRYSASGLPAGLTINPNTGVISGTIAAGASGPAGRADYVISVTATDNGNPELSTTVDFTLTAVNIAPIAVADSGSGMEDTPILVDVLGNDTDADGDAVAVIRVNNVALTVGGPAVPVNNGSVELVNAGGKQQILFTPTANYNGVTTFSYTIEDGNSGIDDAIVSINVASVNDAPVVSTQAPDRERPEGSSVDFTVANFFSDVDGDDLDYEVTGLPPGLVYDAETGLVSGIIASNAREGRPNGVYTVSVTATDGNATVTQTFEFTVTNPPPLAVNDTVAVAEDDSVTFNPITGEGTTSGNAGLDTDPDGDALTIVSVAGGQAIAPGTSVTLTSGILSMNADGSLTYSANANFNGREIITYTISDGDGGTAQAVITVNVGAVNDAPTVDLNGAAGGFDRNVSFTEGGAPVSVATADAIAFDVEDNIVRLDSVLTGFVDGGAELIRLGSRGDLVTGTPASGTIEFGSTTFRFTYDGAANLQIENAAGPGVAMSRDALTSLIRAAQYDNLSEDPTAGNRSLTVRATDAQGATSSDAVATTSVTPVNDPPTSTPIDGQSGGDSDTVTFDPSGSFTDVDGPLDYTATGLPPGLTIDRTTGIITGTIDRSASTGGPYDVKITATDTDGVSTEQSFTWAVVNPAPTAVNDILSVGADGLGSGDVTPGTNGQDSDPDGDPIIVSAVNGAATGVGQAVMGTNGGNFTIGADGGYTFNPGTSFTDLGAGQTRSTSVTYTISDGDGGTSTATVTATVTGTNDTPVAGPLPGQSASDGDPIRIDSSTAFSDPDLGDTLTYTATGLLPGLEIDPLTGEILGTLSSGASQAGPYTITVTATDAGGASATSSFDLAVTNPGPTAIDDTASVTEDTTFAGSVATNDSDGGNDKDPLSFSLENPPANGTLTFFSDGRYTYTPNANFNGTDSFTYQVDDGNGGTATATVTLNVTPVNDAPAAVDDKFVTPEDTPVTFDVRTNDTDVDGPGLTVTAIDGKPITVNQSVPVVGGSVTLNTDGTLTFTPNANYNGSPQFTYTVSDGTSSDSGTVQGQVTPVNDPPTATSPPVTAIVDRPVDGKITGSDPDGDDLTYTVVTPPANGTVTVGTDGSFTFTPNPGYTGGDGFTVSVDDGNGGTVLNDIPITVRPNSPPIDGGETVTVRQDTPITIPVLDNASDPEGDPLTVTSATSTNGTVTINPDGTITFVPEPGFVGDATITYTVSDGFGGQTTSQVSVTVRQATTDVNELLKPGNPFIEEADTLPEPPPFDSPAISAPPVLMNAVNIFSPLNGTADLTTGRPILTAVDGISPLNGTESLMNSNHPINSVVHFLDRFNGPKSEVEGIFENRLDPAALKPTEGFSFRPVGGAGRQMALESIVRGNVIYLDLRDEGLSDNPPIVEFQLRTRSGEPLPSWVRVDARGLAIIERPANADEMRFIAIGIRADGSRIEIPVIIQGATGEIQIDSAVAGREVASAASLARVMAQTSASSASEMAQLLSAFEVEY